VISVCKRFEFEAAHFLPFHKGKCSSMHGHTYTLEVEVVSKRRTLKGLDPSSTGMVLDFSDLGAIVTKHILDELDHHLLNDILGHPTAENLLLWMVKILEKEFEKVQMGLVRLQLWETTNCYAVWRP